MAKNRIATKSQAKARPDAAQLRAIERLLEDGQHEAALRRIGAALRRFPDHGGLHRALVEALEYTKGARVAELAAFAWAERRPNSLPAQEAMLGFAARHGRLLLADWTAEKVRALGGRTPGFPLDPGLIETLVGQLGAPDADVDAMVRSEIGRLHLEAKDFAGTLHWLDGVEIPSARNNRALALFHLDRAAEALTVFLANWEREPGNVFALAWAARLRLYQGAAAGARALAAPLAAADARHFEDALPQIETLLMLGEDQAAWSAFERARAKDWFDGAADLQRATLHHLGASAACRLGDLDAARQWWRAALDATADFTPARHNLSPSADLAIASRLPCIFERDYLPLAWSTALFADETNGIDQLDRLTAANCYLEAMYLGGAPTPLIGILLKRRAQQADPSAAELLRDFARLPLGTKHERVGFISALGELGCIRPGEAIPYFDGEQVRDVNVMGTEIHREPNESGLPPELDALLIEAIRCFNEDSFDAAERRLNDILAQRPEHPIALMNLATVRSAQGRTEDSLRLLRDLVDKHPDYLFGRCSLAQRLIDQRLNDQGALEEAQQLLDGLMERPRLHIQEVFLLWGTQAMLATVRGQAAAAASLLCSLDMLVVDDEDARRLDDMKDAIARLNPMQRFAQVIGSVLNAAPASEEEP